MDGARATVKGDASTGMPYPSLCVTVPCHDPGQLVGEMDDLGDERVRMVWLIGGIVHVVSGQWRSQGKESRAKKLGLANPVSQSSLLPLGTGQAGCVSVTLGSATSDTVANLRLQSCE